MARLLALTLLLIAGTAAAHDVAPLPVREMVRMQGYRAPAPAGVEVSRELNLAALGQQLKFAAVEWRVFAFYDASAMPTPADPKQLILQGERSLVYRVTSARPEQRITILAERRPGSSELFVLSVDLCPEK